MVTGISSRKTFFSIRRATPKLADFGLAGFFDKKPADLAAGEERPDVPFADQSAMTRITGAGDVFGTPAYIAPELFSGSPENASPKSDQYAIGVILYLILCSLRPFQTKRPDPDEKQRILASSTVTPQPPSSKANFRDNNLQYVCMKSLSPDPADRYTSIVGLRNDLEAWLKAFPSIVGGVMHASGTNSYANRSDEDRFGLWRRS
ncbi:MAG: hypothetical protein R3C49_24675 [Planctomycetaceae bacterium]